MTCNPQIFANNNVEFRMHFQPGTSGIPGSPGTDLDFLQLNKTYRPFEMVPSNNPCQVNNAPPFQFSLPELNHTQNGFLFSQSVPSSPPNPVVQFPFANEMFAVSTSNLFDGKFDGSFNESSGRVVRDIMRYKRKPDDIDLPPLKQLITEEKMAESMSRLHICSDTPVSSAEPEGKKIQRLYMCDEMRKLQAESIIPQQILSKIARPCTALVPWRPPIVTATGSNSGANDSNNNNNSEGEIDNYTSDSDRSAVEIEVEHNPNMDLDDL